MQPQIGVSYCYVRSPVNHIYLLLGELNTVAELSIVTNAPENMQRRGAMYLQRELKDKVAMMNRLRHAGTQPFFPDGPADYRYAW
ncbi:hypothetical protein ACLB1E_15265 [Escherichia coli]